MSDTDAILRLPKVCLHEHLDGCLRPGTVAELAEAAGVRLPCPPERLGDWFFQQASAGSLVGYLSTFDLTVAVLQRPPHLARVAHELVSDLAADGVVYAEVRWAPEQHLREGFSPRQIVEAVWLGLCEGMRDSAGRGRPIVVRQILSSLRHRDPNTWAARLAVDCQDLGVVGYDLAGPELGFGPDRFAAACRLATDHGLGLTIHAGEADGPASVAAALEVGATRIGHGIRLIEDCTRGLPGPAASATLSAAVTLEICVSSNLQTGIANIQQHPVTRLHEFGFPISISCDNRLMSRTTATRELDLLAKHHAWTPSALAGLAHTGLQAAFVDAATRARVAALLPGLD